MLTTFLEFSFISHECYCHCRITHIQENAPEEALLVLVGNKCDLTEDQKLSPEEINGLALGMDIKYFQCSVKNNINVEEIVEHVIDVLIEQSSTKKVPEETPIVLQSNQSGSSKSNCAC